MLKVSFFPRYEPKCNLELNLEDALKVKPEEEEQKETVGDDEKQVDDEKDKAPSALDFGFSKQVLAKMGYKFKEDFERGHQDVPAEPSAIIGASPDPESTPVQFLSVDSPVSTCGSNDSVVTSTDDDQCTPVSILKSFVTSTTAAIDDASFAEMSRIEISPGLFVRNPKRTSKSKAAAEKTPSKQLQMSLKKKISATVEEEEEEEISTPKAPELKTINLQKLLADARQELKKGKSATPAKEPAKISPGTPVCPVFKHFTPGKSNLENVHHNDQLGGRDWTDSPPAGPVSVDEEDEAGGGQRGEGQEAQGPRGQVRFGGGGGGGESGDPKAAAALGRHRGHVEKSKRGLLSKFKFVYSLLNYLFPRIIVLQNTF